MSKSSRGVHVEDIHRRGKVPNGRHRPVATTEPSQPPTPLATYLSASGVDIVKTERTAQIARQEVFVNPRTSKVSVMTLEVQQYSKWHATRSLILGSKAIGHVYPSEKVPLYTASTIPSRLARPCPNKVQPAVPQQKATADHRLVTTRPHVRGNMQMQDEQMPGPILHANAEGTGARAYGRPMLHGHVRGWRRMASEVGA